MVFGIYRSKLVSGLALCAAAACVLVTTGSLMAPPEKHRKMEVTSNAFRDGQPIPSRYTCDDKNISPALIWKGAPTGTRSLALIVDDPDSPTGVWAHWVVFNIPGDASELAEDAAKSNTTPANFIEGLNDFKKIGYGGPCPPAGKLHRYYFKLFALDTTLDLPSGASRQAVEAAMTKHILAQGQLMGTYQRK
jgi:Raf kinase inhibitor-like YbhB/YbcL family protein